MRRRLGDIVLPSQDAPPDIGDPRDAATQTLADLRDLYDARLLLEPEVLAQAASAFTNEDAAAARAWLDRQAAAEAQGDLDAAQDAHRGFHLALYAACLSDRWLKLATTLWDDANRYGPALLPADVAPSLGANGDQHAAILAACVAHDKRGAALLQRDHLADEANRLAVALGGNPLFRLDAERAASLPTSFRPAEQAFAPVRPGVDGANVETRDLTVTTYRYAAGAVWQEHAHPEDQLTMLLSGAELRFDVGGRSFALHPGDVLLIPGGTVHSAVVGGQDVVTLNVWRLRSTVPT